MIDAHVLNPGPSGVRSPADGLLGSDGRETAGGAGEKGRGNPR